MPYVLGNPGEIHELARYEVRPESLDQVLAAIHEFVACQGERSRARCGTRSGRRRTPDALHCTFSCGRTNANRTHGSDAVKKFAASFIRCLAPVEFIE